MKLLFSKIVVCIILSIAFLSCSSDDDSIGNPIVGTWQLQSQNFDGSPVTLNDCDLQFTATYTETQVTLTSYNTSNGMCILDETTAPALYRIEGNQLVFVDNAGNVLEDGVQTVFVIENDRLTITVSRPNDPDDQIDINTFIKVTN